MRNGPIACLPALALFLAHGVALAQDAPSPAADPQPQVLPEARPVVPATPTHEDEGPITDPNIPENLIAKLPREKPATVPTHRFDKNDYPVEIVRRPLTLAAEQAQLSLELPFVLGDGHPTLTQILRAAFGITRDWEVGLTYSIGLERLSSEAGLRRYEPGKAFSVGTAYTFLPQILAAEVALAFLADPDQFGLALAVGAPFKLEIGERWAFYGGRNVLRVKLSGLPVDPADPAANLAQLALLAKDAKTWAGQLQIDVGLAYQAQTDLAVFGTFGVGWLDFSTADQPFSLFTGVSYTIGRRVDLLARLGFVRLDEPARSFSIGLAAAARL